jgi:cation transport regulator ChaC
MSYYFAYGSNLDGEQMIDRCPSARLVGAAILYGHRLRFVGWSRGWGGAVADIAPKHGGLTAGVVYELPFDELRSRMDRYEGHPVCYERVRVNVRLTSGRAIRCWTYVKVSNVERANPSADYFATIWYGFEEHGLDRQLLVDAVGILRDRERKPAQRELFS